MQLTTKDVDTFIHERVDKRLTYWSNTKINSTGRGIVVNHILLSSTYYFASIWGGTKKGLYKIRMMMKYYLWSGTKIRPRAKVKWLQCCLPFEKGRINLINPTDALTSLMAKWIVKALEPVDSNLHIMLRHRLM